MENTNAGSPRISGRPWPVTETVRAFSKAGRWPIDDVPTEVMEPAFSNEPTSGQRGRTGKASLHGPRLLSAQQEFTCCWRVERLLAVQRSVSGEYRRYYVQYDRSRGCMTCSTAGKGRANPGKPWRRRCNIGTRLDAPGSPIKSALLLGVFRRIHRARSARVAGRVAVEHRA